MEPENLESETDEETHLSVLRPVSQMRGLKKWVLNKQQQELVDASGLGNLVHTIGLHVDCHLLTAFCELWNTKTNTAHFRGFEMAPSLRDVGYILGVPMVGNVITGPAIGGNAVRDLCLQYLGKSPGKGDHKDGNVKSSWLFSKFHRLPKNPTAEQIVFSTRAYLLFFVGAILFPETTVGFVSPRYLPLLADFDKIKEYAWGAAALAHLYRGLSAVAVMKSKVFAGSAALLMAWIYEYLPMMRPEKMDARRSFPRACRWNYSKVKQVSDCRKHFHQLQFSNVNWEPYKDMDLAGVANYCIVPDSLCNTRTWLISFNIKEIYVPDRCLQQLGQEQQQQQHLPKKVSPWKRKRWNMLQDWRMVFADEIKEFEALIKAHLSENKNSTAAPEGVPELYTSRKAEATASLGLSPTVEDLKNDIEVITHHLNGQLLPVEVARSLGRVNKFIQTPELTSCSGTKCQEMQHQQQDGTSELQKMQSEEMLDGVVPETNGCEEFEATEIPEQGQNPKSHGSSPRCKNRKREVIGEDHPSSSEGKRLRRSSRHCVMMKQFKDMNGAGSKVSNPITLT